MGKWRFNGILWDLPSGNDEQFAIENDHRNSEFSQYEWWFSIAMSNYQMVYSAVSETDFAAHGMLAASQLQTS